MCFFWQAIKINNQKQKKANQQGEKDTALKDRWKVRAVNAIILTFYDVGDDMRTLGHECIEVLSGQILLRSWTNSICRIPPGTGAYSALEERANSVFDRGMDERENVSIKQRSNANV